MSDPIHQGDKAQSTLVSFKFISYFNSHFYTSIVIVITSPLPLLQANEANTHIAFANNTESKIPSVQDGWRQFKLSTNWVKQCLLRCVYTMKLPKPKSTKPWELLGSKWEQFWQVMAIFNSRNYHKVGSCIVALQPLLPARLVPCNCTFGALI